MRITRNQPTTGGGGEAPVTSVNSKTGAVVLNASDVGADPAGAATAAKNAAEQTAQTLVSEIVIPDVPVTSVNGQVGDVVVASGSENVGDLYDGRKSFNFTPIPMSNEWPLDFTSLYEGFSVIDSVVIPPSFEIGEDNTQLVSLESGLLLVSAKITVKNTHTASVQYVLFVRRTRGGMNSIVAQNTDVKGHTSVAAGATSTPDLLATPVYVEAGDILRVIVAPTFMGIPYEITSVQHVRIQRVA